MTEMPGPGLPTWAVVSAKRRAHIERVAALVDQWATSMDIASHERSRWLKAVWLHDALRDSTEAELAALLPDKSGPMALWHGPAAAVRARREGESDKGVLDAIHYHSLGYHGWDRVGRVLYSADYLEPGRSFERQTRAGLAAQYPDAPEQVLFAVAKFRVKNLITQGLPIPEPTGTFWNALVRS